MKNNYYLLRHGHSLRNVKKIYSCWPERMHLPLTEKGINQIEKVSKKLKKIDLIFYSDLLRTKQTAEIAAKKLEAELVPEKRLREIDVGVFNTEKEDKIAKLWKKSSLFDYYKKRYEVAPPEGENYQDVEERLLDFFQEVEKKYNKKNILIVSHQRTLTLLEKVVNNYSLEELINIIVNKKEIETGELRIIP